MRKLVILRRFSQTFFLVLFIYVLWSTTYPLKGLFPPEILFKIDPLVMILTAISERVLLSGLVFSIVMLALTLVLGRFFCGWVCPLGTLIDAAAVLKKRKRILGDQANQKVRRVKFIILFIVLLFAILGIQVAWVFDPLVIVARVISLNIIPAITLAVDNIFIFIIKTFELYGPAYDFYQDLKSSFLGIDAHFFSNSLVTLLVFLFIVIASLVFSRLWCRMFCPLGALFAITAQRALLERKVLACTDCGLCRRRCRTQAIKRDNTYLKGECILCMDCVYDCPQRTTLFSWRHLSGKKAKPANAQGISRRQFLLVICSGVLSLGFRKAVSLGSARAVIRPPGALEEKKFVNTCVRCGNCMKVCITNGLQPILWQAGPQGIWTPQLVPEIGYCEYNCVLCGNVCPTGAIPKLPVEKKRLTKLGVAEIDRKLCIAWAENKECIVCEEHCPVADKAIKVEEVMVDGRRILKPYVVADLCVGCGICQNKCPVVPHRAIRVRPL